MSAAPPDWLIAGTIVLVGAAAVFIAVALFFIFRGFPKDVADGVKDWSVRS